MKKFISLLLTVLIVLTTVPMSFAAEDTGHTHSMSTDCSISEGEQIEYQPLDLIQDGYPTYLNGGNYYLTADAVGGIECYVYGDAPLKLCLNGHKVESVRVRSGKVEICDCQGTATICRMGIVAEPVYVGEKATLSMYGGKVSNKYSNDDDSCVKVDRYGEFNFYGGSLFSEGVAFFIESYGKVNVYCENIVCRHEVYMDLLNAEINVECDYKQCNHICHKIDFFSMFIWRYIAVFLSIFGINQTCKCGVSHEYF